MEHWENLSLENLKTIIDGIYYFEHWKEFPNSNNFYSVSNFGRVRSNERFVTHKIYGIQPIAERILKQNANEHRYPCVSMRYNNRYNQFSTHRLVAILFVPNPENKPCACHIDDNPGAKDAAIWAGVGGGVKTIAGSFAQQLGRDNYPHDLSAPAGMESFNSYEPNNFATPAPAAPAQYDNYPALNTPQVVANPSAGNMDWASQWNNPTTSFKHGGVMVTGGMPGEDDIALVNANTGEDTGKRVSSGEQIVFSEKTLMQLSKALSEEDKDAVFSLVQNQIKKKPNRKGGMAQGAYVDIMPSQGNMDWNSQWGAPAYEEAPAPEYFDVNGNLVEVAPTNIPVVPGARNTALKDNLAYWIPSAAGNAMDTFRFAYGMAGADTPIPRYNKSADWISYVNQLKSGKDTGYSPAERAAFQTQQDRQYLADIANINNASGGSNAIALGNYGRANTQQYLANQTFAASDAAQRRANMQMYGSALGNDVNLDRLIFGDKYQEAKQIEAAGAKTANDAFANIKDRAVVDQFYNPESLHGKTQAMELASKEETAATQKVFLKFMRDNPELLKTAIGSSGGSMDAEVGEEFKAMLKKLGLTSASASADGGMGAAYAEYQAKGGKDSYAKFTKT